MFFPLFLTLFCVFLFLSKFFHVFVAPDLSIPFQYVQSIQSDPSLWGMRWCCCPPPEDHENHGKLPHVVVWQLKCWRVVEGWPTLELKVRNFRSTKLGINLTNRQVETTACLLMDPYDWWDLLMVTAWKQAMHVMYTSPPLIDTKVVLPSHDNQAAVLVNKKTSKSKQG